MLSIVTLSYHVYYELHEGTNVYFILKLVNRIALFHYETAVIPPIKDFRCKSIVIRRLKYSNKTLTIGGFTQKEKIRAQSKYYVWDERYLWNYCGDQIIRCYVDDSEFHSILTFFRSSESEGHFVPKRTTYKVLKCGFYWPTIFRDANFAKM